MSFIEGFAKGFKDIQDQKFAKEMKEEEREYLDKVRKEDRQYQSDAAAAKAAEERWKMIYQASGGITARRGPSSGGSSKPEDSAEVGMDFVYSTFKDAGKTPEDKAVVKDLLVKVERSPTLASQIYKHKQSVPDELYDPVEVARTLNILGPEQGVVELMSMAEMEEAAKTREGTEAALGRLSQSSSGPVADFPEYMKPLSPTEQEKAIKDTVLALAKKDLAKVQTEDGEIIGDEFAGLADEIRLFGKEGGQAETASLLARYAPVLRDFINESPARRNRYQGWEDVVPSISMSLNRENEVVESVVVDTPAPATIEVGEVRKGHEFLGGDPSKESNWKKVSD